MSIVAARRTAIQRRLLTLPIPLAVLLLTLMGGVLLRSLIENVFNLMQVDASYQQLLEGAILLIAFSLYVQRKYAGGERGQV